MDEMGLSSEERHLSYRPTLEDIFNWESKAKGRRCSRKGFQIDLPAQLTNA